MQYQTEFPNFKTSHRFKVVTSGGSWVKARGLKDGKPFTKRLVQQATYVWLQ